MPIKHYLRPRNLYHAADVAWLFALSSRRLTPWWLTLKLAADVDNRSFDQ